MQRLEVSGAVRQLVDIRRLKVKDYLSTIVYNERKTYLCILYNICFAGFCIGALY